MKMKIVVAISIITIIGCIKTHENEEKTFCNPLDLNYSYRIYKDSKTKQKESPICLEAADPVIVLFKDEYFLFSSVTEGYWVSSDLSDWDFIHCTNEQLPNINSYAPAAMVIDSAVYWHQGLYSEELYKSTNPKNPNSWELVSDSCFMHHDPSMYYDKTEDRIWFSYGCGSIKSESISVQEIDRTTFVPKGEHVACYGGDQENHGWERPNWNHTGLGWGWIEGSQIFKQDGMWYLVYSGYDLSKGYTNGVYTAQNPTGPYSYVDSNPVSHKNTGFVGGAAHGHFFQDRYGNWWNVTCASIYVTHPFERRINLFPAGIDKDGYLYTITTLGDYPIKLPQGKRDHRELQTAGWMLLSKSAECTASSTTTSPPENPMHGYSLRVEQGVLHTRYDHRTKYAVDEDIRTFWSAASGNEGEWFKLDLGAVVNVNALQINFAEYNIKNTNDDEKYNAYKIEYSLDNKEWCNLINKWEDKTHEPHDYIQLPEAVKARWVKITNRFMPGKGFFALRDIRVFGNAGGKINKAPSDITIVRQDDNLGADLSWSSVENADGYIVRYGIAPDKLYNQCQISQPKAEIRTLNKGVGYFFCIDAYNSNGYCKGDKIYELSFM